MWGILGLIQKRGNWGEQGEPFGWNIVYYL